MVSRGSDQTELVLVRHGRGAGVHCGTVRERCPPLARWAATVQLEAVRLDLPVTVHAAIGCDIVHMDPELDGRALGEATLRDFWILAAGLDVERVLAQPQTHAAVVGRAKRQHRGGDVARAVADELLLRVRLELLPAAGEVVIANTKGFTGHPMGVGIEDVIAVKILEYGRVPPVPNHKEVDPELGPLNLSRGGRYPVQFALHLAAGFGSTGRRFGVSLLSESWVRSWG